MDFNTAVDRIGFTLAVVLFENELPEKLWHLSYTTIHPRIGSSTELGSSSYPGKN